LLYCSEIADIVNWGSIGIAPGITTICLPMLQDWEMTKTHDTKSLVTDVCFNAGGTRVAACCENGLV
jgi:hypothetical protein